MTVMAKTIKEAVLAGKLDKRLRLLLTAGTKEEAVRSLDVTVGHFDIGVPRSIP